MLLASLLGNQVRNQFRTHEGVKSLEHFFQLLRWNHPQVFLKAIFVTPVVKNPHPVGCALSRI